MTALEYMEKQVQKHMKNFDRAMERGATIGEIINISNKISYYEQAVDALRNIGEIDFDYNAEDVTNES